MPRNLSNQLELEEYFKNKNFEIVNPETENFYNFIDTINNASTIIITWGGALTNLIYLKENTNVYILKSKSYLDENIYIFQKIIDTYKLNVSIIFSVNNEIKCEDVLNEINKKEKTLIGKNNFLFLHNDTSKEIYFQLKNESSLNTQYIKNHLNVKNSLLIIFPDKSVGCKQYLPDDYQNIQRKTIIDLKNQLQNMYDGYECIKNMDDVFYKTDTHMNLKGCYEIYKNSINFFNIINNESIKTNCIEIKKKIVENLSCLGFEIGDLTWSKIWGFKI
jgi:hypothetical protein